MKKNIFEATSMDDPNARERGATPHLGVEFGPPDPETGDKYGVKSVWTFSTRSEDKKRILNYDELEPKYRTAIQQARAYLKKIGLLPKMTAKTSWNSIDVAFTGNGEALVSTDDGTVKDKRIKFAASVYTEDVNYFPY